jgi:hypothetical protein
MFLTVILTNLRYVQLHATKTDYSKMETSLLTYYGNKNKLIRKPKAIVSCLLLMFMQEHFS